MAILDFSKICMAVVTGSLVVGCATGESQVYRTGDGLTAVPGTELRGMIAGQEIRSREPERISDAPTGRGFGTDGRYYDIGPRGGRGVWKIEGDRLCAAPVRDPTAWTCQQIFKDQSGRYYAYSDLLPVGGMPPYYEIYFQPIPQVL